MKNIKYSLPLQRMVKNLPAMKETWVRSLGQENLLEKGMATPVFLPGEFHGERSLVAHSPWVGSQRVRHDLATNTLFNNKTAFFLSLGKKTICVVQLGNFVLCDRSSSPDCY